MTVGHQSSSSPISIELDNPLYGEAFVRLNEQWICEHFELEAADRELAADPFRIVREGGHILTCVEEQRAVGVCALFRDSPSLYQLARMAVETSARGKGIGDALMVAALTLARRDGATRIYLLSNTILAPAIALYRKHGFGIVTEGPHPVYARCNIVMDLSW